MKKHCCCVKSCPSAPVFMLLNDADETLEMFKRENGESMLPVYTYPLTCTVYTLDA